MARRRHVARSLPGHIATVLAVIAVATVVYATTATMFYERWGLPLTDLITPLLPALVLIALFLVALRWPRAGGLILLAGGVVFAAVWMGGQVARQTLSVQVIITAVIFFGPIVLTACLFLLDVRHRRLSYEEGVRPSPRWFARNYRAVLVVGVALLTVGLVSAMQLPQLLSRVDDGFRGERFIEGNGVTLFWAPQGPGWNWKQPDGAYPSWQMLASYGAPPLGLDGKERDEGRHATVDDMQRTSLCAYLDETGTTLLAEPVHLWRMPTSDEIVRSLTRGGENAGCAPKPPRPHAACRIPPEKETPLWAPDEPPFYYWAAGEHDAMSGSCVNYTGGFNYQPKTSRGRSTGFRCVKEVVSPTTG